MSDEQPEIVDGWKLVGFGDDAVAYSNLFPFRSLSACEAYALLEDMNEEFKVPRAVLTRFAERMNHLDANAENDRKLGAAVRAAILVHLTNSKETYSTKYTDELPVRLQMNGPHLSTDVMQAIASALRNEAAK